MRSIHKVRTRENRRHQRHLRVRHKVSGSAGRPRLVVFRSSKHLYAQLVDDTRGVTLVGAAGRSEGVTGEGKGTTARTAGRGGGPGRGQGAGGGGGGGVGGGVGGGAAGEAVAAGGAGGAAVSAATAVSASAKATAWSRT